MSANAVASLADMLHRLGDVPPSRVRYVPNGGPVTEKDIIRIRAKEGRLFELVDGILVEKAMGMRESLLAVYIATILHNFVHPRKLGLVAGADGMMKLSEGLVRIPDMSFIAWNDIPGGKVPKKPVPRLAPTLAVEVLSENNTAGEIKRKRRDYFKAGSSLMWVVNPRRRTVAVYTNPARPTTMRETDTLDGGDVLPGLSLPLTDLFAELDQQAPD